MNYSIKIIKQQNELCQRVELYKGSEYITRLLMHNNPSIEDCIMEYENNCHISYLESLEY